MKINGKEYAAIIVISADNEPVAIIQDDGKIVEHKGYSVILQEE